MPTESKTSARKLTARERERQSLELRKGGATYEEIANKLNMSVTGAYSAVVRALEKIATKTAEDAETVKAMELQRLDRLFLAAYDQAIKGNHGAIDRCLRIMDRRAKYLGLDAPERHDLTSAGEQLIDNDRYDRALSKLADAIRESIPNAGAGEKGAMDTAE